MDERNDDERALLRPSHALLGAAIAGLVCVGTVACSSHASNADDGTGTGTVSSPEFECPTGVYAEAGVTQGSVVPGLTLDTFTAECSDAGGVVEIQPHCGGLNLCRGMSYDTGNSVFTVHTCRATNTCAGYTCFVCGDD